MIADVFDLRRAAQARFLAVSQQFIEQMLILLLLGRGINQTWICRRVLRLKVFYRFKIRRVGDDFCKLLELLKLIRFRSSFFLFSDSGAHNSSSVRLGSSPKRTPQDQDRQRQSRVVAAAVLSGRN